MYFKIIKKKIQQKSKTTAQTTMQLSVYMLSVLSS